MIIVGKPQDISPSLSGTCVTIGNFDGVHKGHQALIKRTCDCAKERDLSAVVVTFDPHPLSVLRAQNPPFITLTEQKLELISQLGPHLCLLLEFTMEMAKLTPEEFVRQYLVEGLNMKRMIIGHDYHLGKGREGNYETLVKLGEKYGFDVQQLEPVTGDGDVVSSTRIRGLVEEGRVFDVRPLLGRFYQVKGEVVHGMNRGGRLLGFPTANLKLVDELFPKPGVYAIWVEVDGEVHKGVANIGKNPTFGNEALSVEAHIMDFDADLYGRDIRVHFVRRIRDEKKFGGIDELKDQISSDIVSGRDILGASESALRVTKSRIQEG